jgi:eukaryotic-like serine/threonine-protein kinase
VLLPFENRSGHPRAAWVRAGWQITRSMCRRADLHFIKRDMYKDPMLRRFQSERQSLALMDHPSIAKVFDADAAPNGQPYFVMECVPGLPITDYCDEHRLTIRERLVLFVKACEGVQHAHQKAIIHRDLKPANILVVEVDGPCSCISSPS